MISADRFVSLNKINVNGGAHTFRAEKLDFKIITNVKIAFIVHFYINIGTIKFSHHIIIISEF